MKKPLLWLVATSYSALLLLVSCKTESTLAPKLTEQTASEEAHLVKKGETTEGTTQALAVPAGFVAIESAPGVTLYKKNYNPPGAPDYVQEINLAAGAKVRFYMGSWTVANGTAPSPLSTLKRLSDYWEEHKQYFKIFSVTNGTFFGGVTGQKAQSSYPVKSDGILYTAGYANNDAFPKRILKIYDNYATIRDYNSCPPNEPSWKCNSYEPVRDAMADAPTAIVGQHPLLADQGKDALKPRTFMGTKDGNGDGKPEILYIYTSLKATQADARQVLLNFGASWTMMLDGGGSTQMICKGIKHVPSTDNRAVLSFIDVFSN